MIIPGVVSIDAWTKWSERFLFLREPNVNLAAARSLVVLDFFKLLLFNHLPNKVPINVSFNAGWSWCVVAASLQDRQTFLLPTGSRLGHTQKAHTDKLEI